MLQVSSVVESQTGTQGFWVQALVPALFLMKTMLKLKERYMALFPKPGPVVRVGLFLTFQSCFDLMWRQYTKTIMRQ